jgi:hypothetical protein
VQVEARPRRCSASSFASAPCLPFRLNCDASDRGAEVCLVVTAMDIDLRIEPKEVHAPDIADDRLDRWAAC